MTVIMIKQELYWTNWIKYDLEVIKEYKNKTYMIKKYSKIINKNLLKLIILHIKI